jgi:hypothetical protein
MIKTTFLWLMFALCEGSVVDLEDSFERLKGMLPKNRQH